MGYGSVALIALVVGYWIGRKHALYPDYFRNKLSELKDKL